MADIDLDRLAQERARTTSFNAAAAEYVERARRLRRISFELQIPEGLHALRRRIERFPYVPSEPRDRDARCFEAYNIQVHGLMQRLLSTGIEKLVIGVSGGLDSTQALIVAARAMDQLRLPRTNILAYSLPGFATTERTRAMRGNTCSIRKSSIPGRAERQASRRMTRLKSRSRAPYAVEMIPISVEPPASKIVSTPAVRRLSSRCVP